MTLKSIWISFCPKRACTDRGEGFPAAHTQATFPRNGATYSETKPTVDWSPKMFIYSEGAVCWGWAAPARKVPPESPRQNFLGSCSGLMEGNCSWSWRAMAPGWIARLLLNPHSCAPILQKAKTQNVRVWSKERFIDGEGANPEFEDPSNASNLSLVLLCGMFYI